MSDEARIEFLGMSRSGESPRVVITIPLDSEHAALVDLVLERLKPAPFSRPSAPIAPLITRGPGGNDH